MKKLIAITAFIIFGLTAYSETSTNYYHRVGGYFYTNLTPYGTWIEIGYGVVAWRPTIIKRNWAPYKIGRWIWTDYGWYWDSYEPFGHIVFHYGRWYYDDYYGWIWIPDYEWAPAWVEWRYDDYYIGWAPLHPYAVFSVNFGIRITYEYYVPYSHWHFVTYKNFCNPYVYNYYVPVKHKYRIYNRTKVRNHYSYYNGRVRNEGIDFDLIRKRTGQTIERRELVVTNNPNEFERVDRSNDKRIRTFIADRNEIERDREALRETKIERSERRPNLDVERIELGEVKRKDRERTSVDDNGRNERSRNVIREENKDSRREVYDNRQIRTEERKREDSNRTNENERQINIDRKTFERKVEMQREDSERKKVNIDSRKEVENERSYEIRNNRNNSIQREDTRVNQQNERRNEIQQRERSSEIRRNDDQRKIESNSNQNNRRNETSERRSDTNRSERTR